MHKEKTSDSSWVQQEIKTVDLGDVRLNHRLGNILEMLSQKPAGSIPAAFKSWKETKAAYRFFDHDNITAEKILESHQDSTLERMRKERIVLLPQDTTELNYTSKPQTQGLGKLNLEHQQGIYLHPTLAVTPERVCLGIVNSQSLVRKELQNEKKHDYLLPIISYFMQSSNSITLSLCLCFSKLLKIPRSEALLIEQKESVRWLNSYRIAQDLAEQLPETQFVSIADREGDIYEIFVEALLAKRESPAEFIIRASKDRILKKDKNKRENKKLKKTVGEAPIVGSIEFDLPASKGRKARRVTQEIRVANVTLHPPKRIRNKLPEVTIHAVLAREINPPFGERPIEWLLLTSLSIKTSEQAIQIISWYLCRWQIEIFFKILKSGCAVEELQLQTLDRLKPCLALYMIIAWRILYMTMLGRGCSSLPCTAVFDDEEWHAVYIVTYRRPPPTTPPDLNTMIKMIASLGGFLNRKGDGFPGPQTIWVGLQRTKDFVIGMEALNASRR